MARVCVLRIAQSKPPKTATAMIAPPQLRSARVLDVASGQQNREYNQHGDRADVDKYLHQPDELRAEQKEKGRDADKRHRETKRCVDELSKRGSCERGREA